MSPSPPKDCHGQCSSPSSPFRHDVENGSFRESSMKEGDTSTIPPKKETLEQHRKWRLDFCNAREDDVDQRIQIDDQPVTEGGRFIDIILSYIFCILPYFCNAKDAEEHQIQREEENKTTSNLTPTVAEGHKWDEWIKIAIFATTLAGASLNGLTTTFVRSMDTIGNEERALLAFLVISMSVIYAWYLDAYSLDFASWFLRRA